MALIEHTLFNTIDKVQTAIERLRAFEPKDRHTGWHFQAERILA